MSSQALPAIQSRPYLSASPLRLIAAERCRATQGYPLYLAPDDARIIAVGSHPYLPIAAIVFVSECNEIIAAVESDRFDVGREILIHLYTRDTSGITRSTTFHPRDGRTVAFAKCGAWDGTPVAGLALLPMSLPGEEC